MCKSESEDLVHKVQKQMRRLAGHFLVATFSPLGPDQEPRPEEEAGSRQISYEVVNSRQALLHHCMRHALQFNSLRYAQYSTMQILYEMFNPSTPAAAAACYCTTTCLRGRADDGTMMIACDVCDGWYHPACVQDHVPTGDESFVCPMCVEAKAEYINDEFCLDGVLTSDLMETA